MTKSAVDAFAARSDKRDLVKKLLGLDAANTRLREQLQGRHRRIDVLERRLRARDGEAAAIVVEDPIARRPIDEAPSADAEPDAPLLGTGFAPARGPVDAVPAPSWAAVLAANDDPAETLRAAWWPLREREPNALRPQVGWSNFALERQVVKTIGVALFGMARREVVAIEAMIARKQAQRGDFAALYIYDGRDFDVFRQRGVVFEWIAPLDDIEAERAQELRAERIAFLRRKWGLATVVHFASSDASAIASDIAGEAEPSR